MYVPSRRGDERNRIMCDEKHKDQCEQETQCQKPEELKGNPKDCSPQQIEKCHGDDKKHCCTEPDDS